MKIKYLLILMFLFCFISTAFGQVENKFKIKNINDISINKKSINNNIREGMYAVQVKNSDICKLDSINFIVLSKGNDYSKIAIDEINIIFLKDNFITYKRIGKILKKEIINYLTKDTLLIFKDNSTRDFISGWVYAINPDIHGGEVEPSTWWQDDGIRVGCGSTAESWALKYVSCDEPDNVIFWGVDVGFYGFGDDVGIAFYDNDMTVYYTEIGDVDPNWYMFSDYNQGNIVSPDYIVHSGNEVKIACGIWAKGGFNVGCGEAFKNKAVFYYTLKPDLEITSVSISPTPPLDENETFTATVYFRNNGEGDAGGFYLDFFMNESSSPTIPCDGDFYTWISGIDAGDSSFLHFHILICITVPQAQNISTMSLIVMILSLKVMRITMYMDHMMLKLKKVIFQ